MNVHPKVGCLTLASIFLQGVPLSARKVSDRAVGSGEGIASFMQLPHVTEQTVKKIGRKVNLYLFPLGLGIHI